MGPAWVSSQPIEFANSLRMTPSSVREYLAYKLQIGFLVCGLPVVRGGGAVLTHPSLLAPQNLLKCNPVHRISAEDALQHPYFTDFCPP